VTDSHNTTNNETTNNVSHTVTNTTNYVTNNHTTNNVTNTHTTNYVTNNHTSSNSTVTYGPSYNVTNNHNNSTVTYGPTYTVTNSYNTTNNHTTKYVTNNVKVIEHVGGATVIKRIVVWHGGSQHHTVYRVIYVTSNHQATNRGASGAGTWMSSGTGSQLISSLPAAGAGESDLTSALAEVLAAGSLALALAAAGVRTAPAWKRSRS
jgi:hypothetical protein